jgi:hypothetical protein
MVVPNVRGVWVLSVVSKMRDRKRQRPNTLCLNTLDYRAVGLSADMQPRLRIPKPHPPTQSGGFMT